MSHNEILNMVVSREYYNSTQKNRIKGENTYKPPTEEKGVWEGEEGYRCGRWCTSMSYNEIAYF